MYDHYRRQLAWFLTFGKEYGMMVRTLDLDESRRLILRVNGIRSAGSVLLMNMTSRLDPIVRANSAPSIVSAAMCFYML
jgi:hypothetical protein